MPELPDVEYFKRYLIGTSLNQTISSLEIFNPKVLDKISEDALKAILIRNKFMGVRRWGKHLFVCLKRGYLTIHFGMTGELKYYNRIEQESDYARLLITFDDVNYLSFNDLRIFGRIGFTGSIKEYIRNHNIGPDALHLRINQFVTIISNANSAIKSFLMDQTKISGIGNLYSDEILYQSRIHPLRRCNSLNIKEIKNIYKEIYHVLVTATEVGGEVSSLPDNFMIKKREPNAICRRCGLKLKREKLNGRTSYYCLHCQAQPER